MHGHFARDCPRKMPPADPAVTEELLALPAPGEHPESDDFIVNTTSHEKQRCSNNTQKHIGCDLMSTTDRNQMTDKSVQEQCENRMFS
ncbi:hypothetical protein E3N88_20653 [Mikania micrantha]|uniref:Uncharacterized protein n=1 Tax=Mikania micrantha TaxID=192012 RepID=A0A5N6NJA8_9ASTR|nr:hypothetical protein E3N88_20653 [Mikania micrantha]